MWERIHEPGDPALGTPLCTGCFDYRATVLWNATATEIWRRTTIAVGRRLASRALALSIGRSKLYELLATGVLRSVRIGTSRRISVDELAAYVQRLAGNDPAVPDALGGPGSAA